MVRYTVAVVRVEHQFLGLARAGVEVPREPLVRVPYRRFRV
jgi:hypothetical protein